MKRLGVLLLIGMVGLALAQVDTAWVRRYDGPEHGNDWATCLAVDSQGNVIVAGTSAADTGSVNLDFVTIKYRPNGDLAWVRREDFGGNDIPYGLGVDGQGNVYVTGSGNGMMTTVKYNPEGQLLWMLPLGAASDASDLVLDAGGNVLISGGVFSTSWDCLIVKYRPTGDTAWVRFYDAVMGYDDGVGSLVVHPSGCVYAAGSYCDSVPRGHCLTLKYDSAGNRLWAARYVGSAVGEYLEDIATDSAGNVLVTGSSVGDGTGLDYLTIKYNPEGETLWVRRYNGPANDCDRVRGLALSSAGEVYVTGYVTAVQPVWECATLKYDSAGNLLWAARYHGPGNKDAQANDIALDAVGCAYITGWVWVSQSVGGDLLVVKYNNDGETLWTRTYNGPGNWTDEGKVITVDGQGNVYVAGLSDGPMPNVDLDIVTIKYVQGGAIEERPTLDAERLTLEVRPNPFRTLTAIRYSLTAQTHTRIEVVDVTGRVIRTLVDRLLPAGVHAIDWDRTDEAGHRVPAGVYAVRLAAPGISQSLKVIVLD